MTKESLVSFCWRLIPYWLNSWEQQWGAECSSVMFELPHFALELLVVLPCVQVCSCVLKIDIHLCGDFLKLCHAGVITPSHHHWHIAALHAAVCHHMHCGTDTSALAQKPCFTQSKMPPTNQHKRLHCCLQLLPSTVLECCTSTKTPHGHGRYRVASI